MHDSTRHYLNAPAELKQALYELERTVCECCGVPAESVGISIYGYIDHIMKLVDVLYQRVFGIDDRAVAVRNLLSDIGLRYDWETNGTVGEEECPFSIILEDEGGPYEGWNSFTLEAPNSLSIDFRRLFAIHDDVNVMAGALDDCWLVSYHLLPGEKTIRIGVTIAPIEGEWYYTVPDAYDEEGCLYVLMHFINHMELNRIAMAALSGKERDVA